MTGPEQFTSKVAVAADGCWLWLGTIAPNGYGKFGGLCAHRIAYEIHVGPIPAGLQIDHLCRVRHCVNPSHLEAVTQQENIRRGMAPSTIASRTGVCRNGHTRWHTRPNGGRECRTCATETQRQRRILKREQAA
jgi:hypothetical protein